MSDQTIEQRLDEILSWGVRATEKWKINQAGKYNPAEYADEIFGGERAKSKQALLQLLNEAQKNGVAWSIGVVDDLHHLVHDNDTTDRMFKGIKNTIRDKHEDVTGIDPAPEYPITAKLNPKENK